MQTNNIEQPIIVIVGAGSLNWGRHIVVDLMLNPDLADAEIRLFDLNPERLAMVHEWCEFARRKLEPAKEIVGNRNDPP
jgi:alpha-galactosidase/6-phospho-beta-glucosidase family protein